MLRLDQNSDGLDRQQQGSTGPLMQVYDLLFFYLALLSFAVVTGTWSLISSVLHAILPLKARQAIGPGMVTGTARTFMAVLASSGRVTLDLSELDRLRGDGGIIIAPNHPTMLDAVMIISRLPRVVCISKAELWDNPLLGGGMRLAGYIRNDTPVKLTKLAVAKLQQGQQLLLFPEGTRTTDWPVNTFRGGFALWPRWPGSRCRPCLSRPTRRFSTKAGRCSRSPPCRWRIGSASAGGSRSTAT